MNTSRPDFHLTITQPYLLLLCAGMFDWNWNISYGRHAIDWRTHKHKKQHKKTKKKTTKTTAHCWGISFSENLHERQRWNMLFFAQQMTLTVSFVQIKIYLWVPLRAVETFRRKSVDQTNPFRLINPLQWPWKNWQRKP